MVRVEDPHYLPPPMALNGACFLSEVNVLEAERIRAKREGRTKVKGITKKLMVKSMM